MQQFSEAVKHKAHAGFLIVWECLQEILLVRMRVLLSCPCDGWLLPLLLSPCCCKEEAFTLHLWLMLALGHTHCPPTIYITGSTYSKNRTPHIPQCVEERGWCNLSVLAIISGVASSSCKNACSWKFSTQALCGVNTWAAPGGVLRKQL